MWSRGVSFADGAAELLDAGLGSADCRDGRQVGPGLALDAGYTSTITYAVLSKSASATSWSNYNVANEVAIKYSSMLESNLMKDRINQALGWTSFPVPSRPRWRGRPTCCK